MNIDMYRVFFPVGLLIGFWGALVWILNYFGLMTYPGAIHPEIMMGGFLLFFVAGFLCTAVPKFTDSFPPTKSEFIIAILLICGIFCSQALTSNLIFRSFSFFIFIFLIVFCVRRFLQRKANPPPPFIFIGFGLLSGVLGSGLLVLSEYGLISEKLFNLARLFSLQGYILSFVLGIGSRLIPSLIGHAQAPTEAQKSLGLRTYSIFGVLFFTSYIIESFASEIFGGILRCLIILLIATLAWKIHLLPKRNAYLAYGLWLSCWFIVFGQCGSVLLPNYRIHLIHLFYIGGLSLMTLLIATRVSFSHGGYGLNIELKSKLLAMIIGLILLASLTRVTAGFLLSVYDTHLLYAATLWIVAVSIWGFVAIPKIISIKNINS